MFAAVVRLTNNRLLSKTTSIAQRNFAGPKRNLNRAIGDRPFSLTTTSNNNKMALVVDDLRKTLHIPVFVGNPAREKKFSNPILFQVDTGCSFNSINEKLARALQLTFLDGDFGTTKVGGQSVTCPVGLVEFDIEIKGKKLKSLVPATILSGNSPNLFGVAALQQFLLAVDMVNYELLGVEKNRENCFFLGSQ